MTDLAVVPHGKGSGRLSRLRNALIMGVIGLLGVTLAVILPSTARAADCSAGYVGLTFDDGPNPSNTMNLLNALKANGLRATMFNIGQNAQNNPSLVRAQVDAGMWVGNHSWTHPHLTQMSSSQIQSELQRTQQVIQQYTGTAPQLFRPPYGETNGTVQAIERQLGLKEILWDIDSQDWNGASTAQIVQAASRLQNGQIILMHDQYQTTLQAIPQIAANLRSRNLCPGMISPVTGRAVAPDDGSTPTITPTPPTTPTPPKTPPVTPTPSGDCTATMTTVNSWPGGFQSNVTVRAGNSAINGWTVSWTWPSGQSITQLWGGRVISSGSSVTVQSEIWNQSIPANGSTTFGFVASGSAATPSLTCTAG